MEKMKSIDTQKLVMLALFTAMVIALQVLGGFIRFGQFSVSLVLMPIAIGAALLGILAGAWLGLVFGFVVLISGDSSAFLAINPAATVLIVLLKGALAGFVAGLMYKLFENRNKTVAAVIAAVVCPIINTGVLILGCYIFFLPTLTQWGLAAGASGATAFIFLVLIGANFFFELGVNIILSPAIVRLIQYRRSLKAES